MTPDDTLVALARGGDPDAFARLTDRYYEDCWRFARRMLADPADAEDAVHETFLRVLRAIGQYEERDRFKAWLFRILANQCRTTALMRARRERRFVADAALVDAAPAADGPALADERLAAALAALAPEMREALLLKYGEEMEYEEMSAVLGVGVSALKMRVSRARAAMRALLGGVDGRE